VRLWSRSQVGAVGLVVGGGSWVAAAALSAQAVAATPGTSQSWSVWLQATANLMQVVQVSAFVFSAYQFWAGRRERTAADVEAAERGLIESNYQAWMVINSAQGKGGSGGRIEALADLLRNGVSLAGVTLDDAWLEGVQLPKATLVGGSLQRSNLARANFAGANLEGADLRGANLVAANLTGAYLKNANLTEARLSAATLDGADLRDVVGWRDMRSISHASIEKVQNPPVGFVAWAREHGAVDASTRTADDASPDPENRNSQQFRAI
jgi:hypothetical protein